MMHINKTIPLLLLFVSLLFSCKKQQDDAGSESYDMLALVNNLRAQGCQCGTVFMPPVKALVWNDTLVRAALEHASDMVVNGYFSHISPSGTSPIQRTMVLGYSGNYVTENIAKGYATVADVMAAWVKSEEHCKAMMDSAHSDMGAAGDRTYWVQEFGSNRQ